MFCKLYNAIYTFNMENSGMKFVWVKFQDAVGKQAECGKAGEMGPQDSGFCDFCDFLRILIILIAFRAL